MPDDYQMQTYIAKTTENIRELTLSSAEKISPAKAPEGKKTFGDKKVNQFMDGLNSDNIEHTATAEHRKEVSQIEQLVKIRKVAMGPSKSKDKT